MRFLTDMDYWEPAVAARQRYSAASSVAAVSTAERCTSLVVSPVRRRVVFPVLESVTCHKNWPFMANSQLKKHSNISDASTNYPMPSSNHKWSFSSNFLIYHPVTDSSRRSAVVNSDASLSPSLSSTTLNFSSSMNRRSALILFSDKGTFIGNP